MPVDPPVCQGDPVPSNSNTVTSDRPAPNAEVAEEPPTDYSVLPALYEHTELMSRDTLYLARLPLDLQFSQPALHAHVQFQSSLLRGCVTFLCGRDVATITFVLGHTLSLPVELSPGLNIISFSKDNLSVSPAGIGGITTFPVVPGDPSFSFYIDEDHYTSKLDDSACDDPVLEYYVLGTRPTTVCLVRPMPTAENCLQPPDWRLRQWVMECNRCEWPVSCPVTFYDLFRRPRAVHKLDWKLFCAWPLKKNS